MQPKKIRENSCQLSLIVAQQALQLTDIGFQKPSAENILKAHFLVSDGMKLPIENRI
jgi:hypothetical protein